MPCKWITQTNRHPCYHSLHYNAIIMIPLPVEIGWNEFVGLCLAVGFINWDALMLSTFAVGLTASERVMYRFASRHKIPVFTWEQTIANGSSK